MAAQETRQVEEDLTYIRGAVERMEDAPYESVTIAVLWAVIITGGFSINDFRPEFSMIYWPVSSITGYLVSLFIGRRASTEAGECSAQDARLHALHWGSIFFLSIAVLVIGLNHGLSGAALGQLFTLVGGAGCFLGGLHLDRRFMLPGAIMIVGAPAISYIQPYPWTIVGLAIGIALVVSAVKLKPSNE
jgi:hypothetical protein